MKKRKYVLTYDMLFMNALGLVIMAFMAVITFFIYRNNILNILEQGEYVVDISFFLSVVLMIVWMILHELIHGIFYLINGAKWENIKFGIALEKGILYCKSSEKITRKNILISVMAPLVLIGIVTYIIGIIINSAVLILLSIFNIVGACGDIVIFVFFITRRDKDLLFKEIGDTTTFYVETTEELKNRQFLGVKLVKEINAESVLQDCLDKKVNISTTSKVVIIIMLILLLLSMVL